MKQQITNALNNFTATDLRAAAIGLLNTPGYQSKKTLEIENTPIFSGICI